MLFEVRVDLNIPGDLDPDQRAAAVADEKEYARELQRNGKCLHLWRILGRDAIISVLEVASREELCEVLSRHPLVQYLKIDVTPMVVHPNHIKFYGVDNFEAKRS